MPFYFAGFLYGQYRDKILETRWGKTTVDIVIAVCLAAWLLIMTRFHLYALPDSGMAIVLRAVSSITGCAAYARECLMGPPEMDWEGYSSGAELILWRFISHITYC